MKRGVAFTIGYAIGVAISLALGLLTVASIVFLTVELFRAVTS